MDDDRLNDAGPAGPDGTAGLAGHNEGAPALRLAPATRRATQRAVDEPHLLDYVRVVVRRRHVAATAFALVLLAAIVYSFTATPIYEGRVQLLIEADDPNVVSFAQVIDEAQTRQDYYQTQYRLLESRSLVRKTIDELDLWENPELAPNAETESFSIGNTLRGAAGWATSLLAAKSPEAEIPDAGETAAQAQVVNRFLDRLAVSPVRNSRLVEVSYRSADAGLAPEVANTLAKEYIERNLEFRFTATREATDWLDVQLAEQRKEVEAAEAELQRYREQNEAISFADRENIVVQKLADINAAVTKAKTDRLLKEAMYRELVAIQQNRSELDTFPEILGNQFIQQQKTELASLQRQRAQMSDTLGERHPDMIKIQSAIQTAQTRIDAEIEKVVRSVRTEYQAAQAQERSLSAALDAQKREALAMNGKAIEYSVLDRDVESSKQIYQSLLQRAKETGISGDLKTSNVRVVDAAEPSAAPVSPRRGLNLLLGLFGGGFLGVGLAFFFEYLDHNVKTPEEIESQLGLPSLGLVPMIPGKEPMARPLLNNGVPNNFAEAFRSLRTNIIFSSAEEGCRSIAVTSTGPGEGKSLVASNLAIGIATAGQRVLLIDADMRRPKQQDLFRLKAEPGLSNLLVGNAKASESVTKTPTSNLWVLPAGRTPPNPAELLGSKRFADFLHSLRDHFDYIIIDTPPVMAVTDAALVGHRASGVLFVIASDTTSRHAAQQALDQLEHANVRFVGAVLNRVDLEREAYYYSRYYRKEYANYYQSAAN